jgi:phage virion morphogenesis protein
MATPFAVTVDASQAVSYYDGLLARAGNPRPAYTAIGEYLIRAGDQNFARQQSPDGRRWAPNTRLTIERYLAGALKNGSKLLDKKGRLNSKGSLFVSSKKILQGRTGMLRHRLFYRLVSDGVEYGSPEVYAAMQQFGGKKSAYPHLLGDIPARPFIGLSQGDEKTVVSIMAAYLRGKI